MNAADNSTPQGVEDTLPLVAPGAEAQAWLAGIPILAMILFGIFATLSTVIR